MRVRNRDNNAFTQISDEFHEKYNRLYFRPDRIFTDFLKIIVRISPLKTPNAMLY